MLRAANIVQIANIVLKKFAWGGNMIKLLVLNMSARIANISEVKVLNKFAWLGVANVIKLSILSGFAQI